MHHAEAVHATVDVQRPLTAEGRECAVRLAADAKARGFTPAAIWHSGKLRARQTAEPFLSLNPFAPFKMVRGLLPEDPPELMRDTLFGESHDLILVGHMPNIAALFDLLTRGDASQFPLHGMVALQRVGAEWREEWRG